MASILILPEEVLAIIFNSCTFKDKLKRLQLVNQKFHRAIHVPASWKHITEIDFAGDFSYWQSAPNHTLTAHLSFSSQFERFRPSCPRIHNAENMLGVCKVLSLLRNIEHITNITGLFAWVPVLEHLKLLLPKWGEKKLRLITIATEITPWDGRAVDRLRQLIYDEWLPIFQILLAINNARTNQNRPRVRLAPNLCFDSIADLLQLKQLERGFASGCTIEFIRIISLFSDNYPVDNQSYIDAFQNANIESARFDYSLDRNFVSYLSDNVTAASVQIVNRLNPKSLKALQIDCVRQSQVGYTLFEIVNSVNKGQTDYVTEFELETRQDALNLRAIQTLLHKMPNLTDLSLSRSDFKVSETEMLKILNLFVRHMQKLRMDLKISISSVDDNMFAGSMYLLRDALADVYFAEPNLKIEVRTTISNTQHMLHVQDTRHATHSCEFVFGGIGMLRVGFPTANPTV